MPKVSPNRGFLRGLFLATATTCAPVLAQVAASAPAPAAAQPVAQTSFVGELLSIVLPLAFIILVLLAILQLARRRYRVTGQDAALSVVQILPLGPRERIVLLRTRTGRAFAVGVSGQSVNLITDLDPADLVPPATTDAAPPANLAGPAKFFGLPLNRRDPDASQARGGGSGPEAS